MPAFAITSLPSWATYVSSMRTTSSSWTVIPSCTKLPHSSGAVGRTPTSRRRPTPNRIPDTTTPVSVSDLPGRSPTAGATTPGSSNTSFVNGPVRKIFNATEAFTFPIGVTGTGDEPLGIAGSTALNDDFTAQYLRSSAAALGGVTPPILNVSACDQWILTKNSGPGANVSVTLSWDANSPCGSSANFITDPSSLTVAHFNGSTWDEAGTGRSHSWKAAQPFGFWADQT